jgi:hypothetical protein
MYRILKDGAGDVHLAWASALSLDLFGLDFAEASQLEP